MWRVVKHAAAESPWRNAPRASFKQLQLRCLHQSSVAAKDDKLFDTLLVANRGEIACRVMRTCKKLGIKSVAVYSEADANALHTRTADMRYCIGPPPSNQSYLKIDKIVDAINATGAQAVHPGYGFLSENRLFSKKLEEIGVAFCGPKEHAIFAMGDKLESKVTARKAKVNIIPGFDGVIKDAEHAVKISNEIGYPVMLKASAGGGGKGMRVAWNDQEAYEGFRLASDESRSSFGDDRMLIEKFIDNPRHIEIQILADSFGNTIYLNERECSIQRRNQKVVEEAPSVFLDAATRKAMGEQACALARAVQYQSAGTVEFLVDSKKNFYFLEMNTRLQVEHAITECITGVDIVEQMIRVAAGLPLTVTQDDIKINGWAIEARVYAEDPLKFLPSTGRLSTYIEPTKNSLTPGMRIDTGIVEGSQISIYYDPMIAKLVTHGKDRADALTQMRHALDSYVIKGVTHNIPLLRDIIQQPRFISGEITTKFIPEVYPDGFHGFKMNAVENSQLVASAAFFFTRRHIQSQSFTNQKIEIDRKFYPEDLMVTVGKEHHHVSILSQSNDQIHVKIADTDVIVKGSWPIGAALFTANINGQDVVIQHLKRDGPKLALRFCGTVFDVVVRPQEEFDFVSRLPEKVAEDHSNEVLTPMPGTLISLAFKAGDAVLVGNEVAVVEAMKMQNQLKSPVSGVVKAVYVKPGSTMPEGQAILEFYRKDETQTLAPSNGHVVAIKAKPGDKVLQGQELASVDGTGKVYTIRAVQTGVLTAFALEVGSKVTDGEVVATVQPDVAAPAKKSS